MNPRQRSAAARRMTHRSRSVATVITLTATVIVAAWIGVEATLAALDRAPLIASPQGIVDLVTGQPWLAWTIVASLGVIGIVTIVLALTPARLTRHELVDERSVIVIDDSILAGALSRTAAASARLPAGNVRTLLGRRTAHVSVLPLSGFPVDAGAITAAVEESLKAAHATRSIAPRVTIAAHGAVPA